VIASGKTVAILSENSYILQVRYRCGSLLEWRTTTNNFALFCKDAGTAVGGGLGSKRVEAKNTLKNKKILTNNAYSCSATMLTSKIITD